MEEDIMYLIETVFGLTGALIFALGLKWARDIFRRFEDDEELAATQIFLQGSIVSSLRIVAVTAVFFALTGVVSLYGIYSGNEMLSNAVRLGSLVLFMGYIQFHYSIHSSLEKK